MLVVAAWYARLVRVGVSCGSDDDDEQHGDDEYGDHGLSFVSPPHRTRRRGSWRVVLTVPVVVSVLGESAIVAAHRLFPVL